MKVEYQRTGGHLPTTFSAQVDTGALAPRDAAELRALVDRAGQLETPQAAGSSPDAFTYRLAITTDTGEHREVTYSDMDMPPQLRPLVRWLQKRSTGASF